MKEKDLRKLYKKFLKLDKSYFILDAIKHSTSLENLKLSKKIVEKFYENYYKVPFFNFLENLKAIVYSKNIFDIISQKAINDWEIWPYLKILTKEKIIKIEKNGKPVLLKKNLQKIIPPPREEREIREKIEKKLKVKIKDEAFVIDLFKKFRPFKVKAKWDQMPISQESAIFLTKKILEKLPFHKKFLLIGDDDFISVILTLVEPNLECLVVDIDDELLECINFLAKKFKLKIETKKIDIRKRKKLRERIVGFLTNPIYTEDGVKEFVKYGKEQFGKDGGIIFLEVGDESIKNRFLFLQDFFQKNNLIIDEIIKNKIYYPYIELYKEDKVILKRFLSLGIEKKTIEKSPKLGAALYILKYLPFRPKRIKFKKPIYAYL